MEDSKNNCSHPSELASVETEGKTPQEAIKKALSVLGVARREVEVKILSEEEKGLFGMEGARPAKVRVTLWKKTFPSRPAGRQASKI